MNLHISPLEQKKNKMGNRTTSLKVLPADVQLLVLEFFGGEFQPLEVTGKVSIPYTQFLSKLIATYYGRMNNNEIRFLYPCFNIQSQISRRELFCLFDKQKHWKLSGQWFQSFIGNIPDMWLADEDESSPVDEKLIQLLDNARPMLQNVKKLVLTQNPMTQEIFREIITRTPNLKSLSAGFITYPKKIQHLFEPPKQTLQNESDAKPYACLHQLEKFAWRGECLSQSGLEALARNVKTIRKLTINSNLNPNNLTTVLKLLVHLESVNIKYGFGFYSYDPITPASLQDAFKALGSLKHLRILKLDQHQVIREQDIRELAGHPSLTFLDISTNDVDPSAYEAIGSLSNLRVFIANFTDSTFDFRKLASLQNLKLLDAQSLFDGNENCKAISEIKSLQALFVYAKDVTDEGAMHLSQLPDLREISLNRAKITKRTIRHLVKNCPKLSKIYLDDSNQVDKKHLTVKEAKCIRYETEYSKFYGSSAQYNVRQYLN
jgi:hypothetical protein